MNKIAKSFFDTVSLMLGKIEAALTDEADFAEIELMKRRLGILRSEAPALVIKTCADTLKDFHKEINAGDDKFLLTHDFSAYIAKKQLGNDGTKLVAKLLGLVRKAYTAMQPRARGETRELVRDLYQYSLEYVCNS